MPFKPARFRHLPSIILLGVLAFIIGASLREPAVRAFFNPSFLAEWYRVGLVMRVVNTRYLEAGSVPFDHLARNASAGAAARLDRYSEYLDSEDYAAQNKHAEQLFTGIGVLMRQVDGLICVERVLPQGGAESAGVKAGDRIILAGDADLTGLSIDKAAALIKGAENTPVVLTLHRPGVNMPIKISVLRRTIPVSSIAESRLISPNRTAAYIRVSGFERRTPEEIRSTLDPLLRDGARSLILDLRGNPGGLVDAAIDTVGLFCPSGSLVVKITGRTQDDSRAYLTRGDPAYPKLPLVILVDNHSASASEIVAGALRDHQRAALVGAKTFGKGLVQSIFQLDEKTGLKITTARYTLPGGAMIHGTGVSPDLMITSSSVTSVRIAAESAQIDQAGGREAFLERFGYIPGDDEVIRAAEELLRKTDKP